MKGKSALMAGVAAIALIAAAQAGYAGKKTSDGTSAPVAAAPSGPTNAELAARVQALEDALQASETKADSDHGRLSALEQNFNYTTWTFDNGRPVVSSGDGRFSLAFRVRFQFDNANFMQDSAALLTANAPKAIQDLSSGAVIRRGFFGVEGKAFKDFWYEFRLNAGGSNGGSAGASGVPKLTSSTPRRWLEVIAQPAARPKVSEHPPRMGEKKSKQRPIRDLCQRAVDWDVFGRPPLIDEGPMKRKKR